MFTYKAIVRNIVDGDTIDVSIDCGFNIWFDARCRLYGINAPESRTKNLEEKNRGLAAKKWLSERIPPGAHITIKTVKDDITEKFGRYLAEVSVASVNINQEMINEGHAVAYFGEKRD